MTGPNGRGGSAGITLALARRVAWLVLFAAGTSGTSFAEPYIAVREGYKCSVCHVNMTGGGKRTDFANIYVQTRLPQNIVQWTQAADPPGEKTDLAPAQTLYDGNLNEYFSVGGDLRVEYSHTKTPHESDTEQFVLSKGLLYLRMNLIPETALFYVDQDVISTVATREMFMLFQGRAWPTYAKIGKFFLPSGLRLQDDTAYIRATTRFNYGVTDTGVELGVEPGPFTFSVAYTNGATQDNKKVAAYGYAISRHGMFGLSSSAEKDKPDNWRRVSNVFAGLYFGRTSWLFEVDRITDSSTDIEQEAALLELDLLIAKGANLKLTYEYLKPDVNDPAINRDRTSIVYEPFLNQFLQLRLGARKSAGPRTDNSLNSQRLFAELHVFF
jgi:hypothetical protein